MSAPERFSVTDALRMLRSEEVTSRQLVEHYLQRIERFNPHLNAVVTVDREGSLATADRIDRARREGGSTGPLAGLPMTVKDCWATAGMRTTAGSEQMAGHVPAADAPVVARLRTAGVVILGKTNLPEGVTGQETANSLFGRTLNPWDPSLTPGGSSGGAAAAVAAGLSPLDFGSDSGGSVRQPAHLCGVFGHVITQGAVPLRGHLPSIGAHDVDSDVDLMCAGPLASSASDLEAVLEVVTGPDRPDALGLGFTFPEPRRRSESGWRIGVMEWSGDLTPSSAVAGRIETAAAALQAAGNEVVPVRMPFAPAEMIELAFRLWVASTCDSTDEAQHERLKSARRYGTGPNEALRRYRADAQTMDHRAWLLLDARRREMTRAWMALLDRVEVILCPVSPVAAFPHDPAAGKVHDVDRRLDRTLEVDGSTYPYLSQIYWNTLVGMARLPSTVAPVGLTPQGLPVGVQIVGPRFADRSTITVGGIVAQLTGGDRTAPGFAD